MFWRFVTLIFLIPVMLLTLSHLGALHPLGDSLAVFRAPLIGVGVLSLAVFAFGRSWRLVIPSAMLLLWSAYTVLIPSFMFSAALDAPYVLYQKNMSFRMPDVGPLAVDIRKHSADFITLQEVDRDNLSLLKIMKQDYPAQAFCEFAGVGGVAVMARWPMVAGSTRCDAGSGMVAMQIITPDGPVWLVSLHLHWAYPHGQAAQVQALLPALSALDGPVILAGDFNMVPWSHTMASIMAATKTRRLGAPKYTFSLFGGRYRLPIDHVLVNRNTRPSDTTLRPLLGSDHHGLLARFYLK